MRMQILTFTCRWFSLRRASRTALIALGAALGLLAGAAWGAEKAGEVIFVIGKAHLSSAVSSGQSGAERVIARGDAVEVGDRITTSANGYVHMRLIDQGFVSMRPQSRLTFDAYHYDSARPAENRVKFTLENGVMRTITGRAGEAARQNYRLNTPLAAIGVRGTDYAVQASADVTRVSVFRGTIVMAPLNGGCTTEGLGPCDTAAARQLTDAMKSTYIELRAQSRIPELIPAERGKAPNRLSPPLPEEPAVEKNSRNEKGMALAEVNAATSVSHLQPAPIQSPVIEPPQPAAPPAVAWGRWSAYADPAMPSSSVLSQLTPEREIAVSNPVFGLARDRTLVELPESGKVNFQLAGSEAYLRSGNTLLPASVTDPRLSVDFAARRFDTSLNVVPANAALSVVPVSAAGRVTFDGYMISDPSVDTQVVGALAGRNAREAGYLFEKLLPSSLTAIGATRWNR